MSRNEFGFELPTNYVESQTYLPPEAARQYFPETPWVVGNAIVNALPEDVPTDALNVFYYLKRGWIPNWVVIYFMRLQQKKLK